MRFGRFLFFFSCALLFCPSALSSRLNQFGAGEISAGHHKLHAFLQREQWQEHTEWLHIHTYEFLW